MLKYFILICLLLTSCIKGIELPDFEVEPVVVVNALIRNTDSSKVFIETTEPFNEDTPVSTFDNLNIFAVSNLTDTIPFYYKNHFYLAKDSFMPGSEVDIYILSEAFTDFYTLNVPQYPPIVSAKQTIGRKYDSYGDPITEVRFVIKDEASKEDFYLFYIYTREEKDPPRIIGFYNYYKINDPALINEGILDYSPDFFILSDKLFNGENYEVNLELVIGTSVHSRTKPGENYLVIQKITKDYYLFLKSWLKHKHNQNTGDHTYYLGHDPFTLLFQGEPVSLFSNSSTGYGIVAGYSERTIKLIYDPDL